MTKGLHILKLALPGRVSTTVDIAPNGRPISWHTRPCGCRAYGIDAEALTVDCCSIHFPLLAADSPPWRAILDPVTIRRKTSKGLVAEFTYRAASPSHRLKNREEESAVLPG
jgi:hypothetical protein